MADVAKIKRQVVKGALTRFNNWFENLQQTTLEDVNLEELQCRLLKVESLLDEFSEVQLVIESEDDNYSTNADTLHAQERLSFEDRYFRITSAARNFISKHSSVVNSDAHSSTCSHNSGVTSSTQKMNIQLPAINIPTYDGSYDKWLLFRDSFNSIIHNNTQLSNIQKFHYLRLSLKGTDADTISSLEVSDVTYQTAWKLLQDRFENKNILVNIHIKALFNLPSVHKDSHQDLRRLIDNSHHHLRSLESLKMETTQWDPLIIHLVMTKLDNCTHKEWEQKNTSGNLPTLDDLFKFLKSKCHVLETLSSNPEPKTHSYVNPNRKSQKSFVSTNSFSNTCFVCKAKHTIYSCPDLLKLEPVGRLNQVKRLRLCVNCLGNNHSTKDCKSSGCKKCGGIHHTLLHFKTNNTQSNHSSQDVEPNEDQANPCSLTVNNNCFEKVSSQILLSTAIVQAVDRHNNVHLVRALLDNGSQSNFISESLCTKLDLNKQKIEFSISGINSVNTKVTHSTLVKINSSVNNYTQSLSCLVLPVITGNIPTLSFDRINLNIPKNITLADPTFNLAAPIELLIGADIFWDLLCVGQIKLGPGKPILQKTKLGYIVSGPISLPSFILRANAHCNLSINDSLNLQLRRFWELEDLSKEEVACEKHFRDTTVIDDTGRFCVSLPLKDSISKLGDSITLASRRFSSLERKFVRNEQLKTQYTEFIDEYLSLNHKSRITNPGDNSGYFLPHHAVFKDSSTTKLRVVFDASAKTTSGVLLNDLMMVGPTIQNDLVSLRFRKHVYVLSADIAKMYRQILIKEDERHLQRIVWRSNPEHPLSVYQLNTVTYGTSSAPFLAIRALQEIAHIHSNEYPKIAETIIHDFHVDDLLTGASSVEELSEIKKDLSAQLTWF